jgi:chromosome segregation ATPase
VKRIITPEITRDVLRDLRAILMERTTQAPAEAEALEAQVAKLRREIGRLTEALASSDDQPDAIVQAISQRSTRLRQLEAQLATMEAAIGTVDLELRRLEKEATQRLQNLHDEFSCSPESAKSALAALVGNSKLRSWR